MRSRTCGDDLSAPRGGRSPPSTRTACRPSEPSHAEEAAALCADIEARNAMGVPRDQQFVDRGNRGPATIAASAGYFQTPRLASGEEHVLLLDFMSLMREVDPVFPFALKGEGVLEGLRWGLCPTGDFDVVVAVRTEGTGAGRLAIDDRHGGPSYLDFSAGTPVELRLIIGAHGMFFAQVADAEGQALHTSDFFWELYPNAGARVEGNIAIALPNVSIPRMTIALSHGDLARTFEVVNDGTTWREVDD